LRLFTIAILLVALVAPAAATAEEPVRAFGIESKILGEERIVVVRTPRQYAQGARYPVLYLTDGEAQFEHTVSTVEFLARNERMPELIIVGVFNTDRTRDLTPTSAPLTGGGGEVRRFPTAGGADRFLDFFEKELIPYVDASYRTEPYRIFAGHSFGGLFAMYALVARPGLFQAHVSVAPSLGWDERLIERRLDALLRAKKDLGGSVFITLGEEPPAAKEAFDRVRALLQKRAPRTLEWEALYLPDEDHGSIVLLSHYRALRMIFSGWRMPAGPGGVVAGGFSAVEAHYRRLSGKYGYEVAVPEMIANVVGYQTMNRGEVDAAIDIFLANAARYPRSANVWDSLGEAYEKKGEREKARESYAKAVELGAGDANLETFKANLERLSR
jgi:uncharacterized protein